MADLQQILKIKSDTGNHILHPERYKVELEKLNLMKLWKAGFAKY